MPFRHLKPLDDIVQDLLRRGTAAQVRADKLALSQICIHGLVDGVCSLGQIQKLQHDTDTPDGGDGIGDAFPFDIRRRTMARLADDDAVADIRAGHETQRADEGGGAVGEEITVQVWSDDHVVVLRLQEQLVHHAVDDLLLDRQALELRLRERLPRRRPEQPVRLRQHIRLVCDGDECLLVLLLRRCRLLLPHLLPPHGNLTCDVGDAPRRLGRDPLDRFGDLSVAAGVRVRLLLLHVQVLGVFPHDHQVDRVWCRGGERGRQRRLAWSYIRVQRQFLPERHDRGRVPCNFGRWGAVFALVLVLFLSLCVDWIGYAWGPISGIAGWLLMLMFLQKWFTFPFLSL